MHEALDEVTDHALLRRAALGDGPAYEQLFRRHFPSTFQFAVHMLDGDESLAQDAAQNAWVKVWRRAETFRGGSQVRTWIFSVVAREVAEVRRRRRPVVVDPQVIEQLWSGDIRAATARVEPSAEAGAERRELWQLLALALVELPWRQREAFLLREFEGMSYEEIALVLHTTRGVVRGQLHRARQALAIRMEQWR